MSKARVDLPEPETPVYDRGFVVRDIAGDIFKIMLSGALDA